MVQICVEKEGNRPDVSNVMRSDTLIRTVHAHTMGTHPSRAVKYQRFIHFVAIHKRMWKLKPVQTRFNKKKVYKSNKQSEQ